MARCPNCGQKTARTDDWACQHCGYPLLSNAFKKVDKTYREVKGGEQPRKAEPEEREADEAPVPPPPPVARPVMRPKPVVEEKQPEPLPRPLEPAQPEAQNNANLSGTIQPEAVEPEAPLILDVKIQPPLKVVPVRKIETAKPVASAPPSMPPAAPPQPEPAAQSAPEPVVLPAEQAVPAPAPLTAPAPGPVQPTVQPDRYSQPAPQNTTNLSGTPQPVIQAKPEPPQPQRPNPILSQETVPNDAEITAAEIAAAFKTDRVNADARLRGKVIRVTGTVGKMVIREHLDILYIILTDASSSDMYNIRGTFSKEHGTDLRRLQLGDTVTIAGKYNGAERNIILNDCMLVR